MPISDYLSEHAVIRLRGRDKAAVFRELSESFSNCYGGVSADHLHERIWERERAISTWVSPGIAIAHAILDGYSPTRILLGLSREGVDYGAHDERPVHLIVLLVGDGIEHLNALRQTALRLSSPGMRDRLVRARSRRAAYDLLTRDAGALVEARRHGDMSRIVFDQACQIARATGAAGLLLYADCAGDLAFLPASDKTELFLVTSSRFDELSRRFPHRQIIELPFKGMNRTNQIELSIIFSLSRGLFKKGDRIVSVFGLPPSGMLDSVRITDVDKEFNLFLSLSDAAGDLAHQVMARALEIAGEIAEEGREGRPCGTIFVLGDHENVQHHCQQMIINPFRGYPEQERNILDPSLKETVKEMAKLDGAFIIRGDGVLMSAGTYIRTRIPLPDLPPGLGSRHAAAAAVTALTQAVSLALSESTRVISLFKGGERVMEL